MIFRFPGQELARLLRKLAANPIFEVVVAIIVVLVSAWWVVSSEFMQRTPPTPVLFGHR